MGEHQVQQFPLAIAGYWAKPEPWQSWCLWLQLSHGRAGRAREVLAEVVGAPLPKGKVRVVSPQSSRGEKVPLCLRCWLGQQQWPCPAPWPFPSQGRNYMSQAPLSSAKSISYKMVHASKASQPKHRNLNIQKLQTQRCSPVFCTPHCHIVFALS